MLLLPIVERTHEPCPAGRAFDDSPHWHRFDSESAHHVYVSDGSRIYSMSREAAHVLDSAGDDPEILQTLGIDPVNAVDDEPACAIPVSALSLAVAQTCNLSCSYCYAHGGSFGDAAKSMPAEVALQAVNRLLSGAPPGGHVNLAFLGGEPLANRDVLRLATEHASAQAQKKNVSIGFSITTNGTLVTPEDGEFFERFGFAVTISLDGVGDVHNSLRPFRGGRGSYAEIIRRVEPLLALQESMQVSARVTVTPRNLQLRETLEEFLRLGFHSVGFSPMLASPTGHSEMPAAELDEMLTQMIGCGQAFEAAVSRGDRFPFTNMVNAMREIHRGSHRPYPCGAGAGYFGVSADGDLFACHRFVGDSAASMGTIASGVDLKRQGTWLRERHVHLQQPCSDCWARYLCGGGCHHEVIKRGRPACNYIRGWLDYCLGAYVRLRKSCPRYFGLTKLPASDP